MIRRNNGVVILRGLRAPTALLLFVLCHVPAAQLVGQEALIDLSTPPEGIFVMDRAQMLNETAKAHVQEISSKLLNDTAVPLIVVTIESMGKYTPEPMPIELFARHLFDQWGIGHVKVAQRPANRGILLLIARDDRQARIELGNDWERSKDRQCQQIMDSQLIPRCRDGNPSAGVMLGVDALHAMVRGLEMPRPTRSGAQASEWLLPIAIFGIALFVVVYIARRRKGALAWVFRIAVIWALVMIFLEMTKSWRNASEGFDGGPFGKGFSGGGGAVGYW